jgi:3-hydroxybutyrate dehydrogenase
MSQFDGKVALITGAASGIGKHVASRLAAAGAIPVIADLNFEAAKAAADELGRKTGFAVAMDVANETSINTAVSTAFEKFGRIDILVSNAGIQIIKSVVDLALEEWRRMLAIHLDGAFLITRACLKHMYRARTGSIIYMGSVHSKEASMLKAPYVTAKHGLIGLCKVVAKEGARFNVRSNVVCPGLCTPRW